jgi:signal transduction histidine kinase/CheY-like chemotaxis protein
MSETNKFSFMAKPRPDDFDDYDENRRNQVSIFVAKISIIMTFAWAAPSFALGFPYLASGALVAAFGHVLALGLHQLNMHSGAKCVWLVLGSVGVFIAACVVHPSGNIIYIMAPLSGVPFLVFSWDKERGLLVFTVLVSLILWIVAWALDFNLFGFYEIGEDIASKYISVAAMVTVFGLIATEIGFFASMTANFEKNLRSERARAEYADQSKSLFLANMSHEIRTPMNGVVGMAEILSRTDLRPEQEQMIRTIRNSSESLLRIIDDILDISKIEAGKLNLETDPVCLETTFEEVVEMLRPAALERRVHLLLFYDPSLPKFVRADAVRVRQILINLVGNAIKFSQRNDAGEFGTVHLRATAAADGRMLIKVSDDGVGMSADVLANLFQPFYQGEQSTKRVFGGTGLGLVISKTLVDLMGGDISADSSEGHGATFIISLPIEAVSRETDEPDISDLEVLAISETAELREVLTTYCSHHCGSIRFAETEAELQRLVAARKDSAIVLLGMETAESNDRLRSSLSDGDGRMRFLRFSRDRHKTGTCVLPDCYIIQSYPVLPSELRRGLAILAGRTSPEVEYAEGGDAALAGAQDEARHILLVEDNETNQDVITTQLKMLGYGVEVARNGAEGLEKWKRGSFDLVLADCHMPVMDGFEMTGEIRKYEENHDMARTPIVAITANALKGEAEKCLAAGMDDFLSKPVVLVDLKKTLGGWISRGA